jgi:DNA polymerase III delta subunit
MAKKGSSRAAPGGGAPSAADRVVLLAGPEVLLRQEATDALRAALAEAHGQIDVVRFDGETAPIGDVLDECRSFGLLAGHKLVVVDNADALVRGDDNKPILSRYIDSPCEGATLVLRSASWRSPNLEKQIAAAGTVVECKAPGNPRDGVAWVTARAKAAHRAAIEPDAAMMLVDLVGLDLARLDGELGKLATGAGTRPISVGLVGELVGRSREEDLWSIQRELLSGSAERALGHLRRLLDLGARDANIPVSFACCDLARKLALAAGALADGANEGQAASAAKLWGESRGPILSAARRAGPAGARRLLRAAVRADVAQKSGLGRPDRVLERLALDFVAVSGGSSMGAPHRAARGG